ncbi:ferritin [Meiothermus sp. CFH 77666]|uniref:ferritin n=1 Tax=Meiothermus sp. CFH 77666 TaxID=2817942 RepID=UPI001FB14187|nr:ferritin [Meiothermus sp. CFH 77666]
MMISEALAGLLNQQIVQEFRASQVYLGMSVYCTGLNLDGWTGFFERQSQEEREHALKIVRFLSEAGAPVSIEAVPGAATRYGSLLEAVSKSLEYERKVSDSFRIMAKVAQEHHDHTGYGFLQWFLGEQIEEENIFARLEAVLESSLNPFQAETLPPKE